MQTMHVLLVDGDAPPGSAKKASIACENASHAVPYEVRSAGDYLSFSYDVPETWTVKVQCMGCKTKTFVFAKTTESQLARCRMAPILDVPIARSCFPADPVPIPPSATRLLGTYQQDGIPAGGVPWTAGAESGNTDSLGRVMVQAAGPLPLAIGGDEFEVIGDGETVTVNVSSTDA